MPSGVFGILVACRANECRSPAVAALLSRAIAPAAAFAEVRSGGISTTGGHPADPVMAALVGQRGIDLSAHRSRAVDHAVASGADLVIAASRAHLRILVGDLGAAFSRSFTLRELERRAAAAPARERDESLASWIARLGAGRSPAQLLGRDADDDLADPTGRTEEHYRHCLAQIERSVAVICERGGFTDA